MRKSEGTGICTTKYTRLTERRGWGWSINEKEWTVNIKREVLSRIYGGGDPQGVRGLRSSIHILGHGRRTYYK